MVEPFGRPPFFPFSALALRCAGVFLARPSLPSMDAISDGVSFGGIREAYRSGFMPSSQRMRVEIHAPTNPPPIRHAPVKAMLPPTEASNPHEGLVYRHAGKSQTHSRPVLYYHYFLPNRLLTRIKLFGKSCAMIEVDSPSACPNGRCATCHWWEQQDDETRQWSTNAEEEPFKNGSGACLISFLHASDGKNMDRIKASKARAVDASGYFATLITAPDFGCVQWEAKQ